MATRIADIIAAIAIAIAIATVIAVPLVRLGLWLFEHGSTALASTDLHRVANPFVEALTKSRARTCVSVCSMAAIWCWSAVPPRPAACTTRCR
jgi:DNA-binding IclR family transcriptional regulator